MYIHLETWNDSRVLDALRLKGLRHGTDVVKVYASASDKDPILLAKPHVRLFYSSHEPFYDNEVYTYEGGRVVTGADLERKIQERRWSPLGEFTARALLRFANRPDIRATHDGMAEKINGQWLIENPVDQIDDRGRLNEGRAGVPESHIHLEFFLPETLTRLKHLVNYHDTREVVTYLEKWRILAAQGETMPVRIGLSPEQG